MPETRSNPSVKARLYIAVVIAAGAAAVASSAYQLSTQPFRTEWLVLTAITLLTGAFGIQLPHVAARVSVSEAFVFAGVLLYGPSVATVIVALDTLVLTSWFRRGTKSFARGLFTLSSGASAMWISSHIFEIIAPKVQNPTLGQLFFPVMGLAACFFAINSGLIAIAVSSETAMTPIAVWRRNFAWLSLNYLGGASVAMLLVSYRNSIDFAALAVMVPLLVITYRTFRTSLERLEDAHQHVSRLNDLYISTIETLALAVDAKDQITHGHIRRVQVYALEMAKRLGVTDPTQLRAIEAAALLHDMGKLAIPEHILNKPGKLTEAEFDTMKRHSDIGADLLSSIRFPYPVVPIVRHHHERWDGAGYPSGIAGTDIPLGARILSVVDCFDALNSDRPYRKRLSLEDSFAILRGRRGSMYDPLVVDLFCDVYSEIAQLANAVGQQARSLVVPYGVTDVSTPPVITDPLPVRRSQPRFGSRSVSASLTDVSEAILRVTPSIGSAYFEYRSATNELTCVYVSKEEFEPMIGLTMSPGERVSGWAAANLKTVSNSDPALEFGDVISLLGCLPKSMISSPVLGPKHAELKGVLSAYSLESGAFSPLHTRAFEQLAESLAERLPADQDATALVAFPFGIPSKAS